MRMPARVHRWGLALTAIFAFVFALRSLRTANRRLSEDWDRSIPAATRLQLRLQTAQAAAREQARQLEHGETETSESYSSGPEQRRRSLNIALDEILAAIPLRPPRSLIPQNQHGILFPELMSNPAYAQNVRYSMSMEVELDYGPWLRALPVSEEVRARISQLLLNRNFIEFDTDTAASMLGLDAVTTRKEAQRLNLEFSEKVDAEIRNILGDSGLAQLQREIRKFNNRSTVKRIVQRLSYSDEPLTFEQTNRLLESLIGQTTAGRRSPTGGPTNLDEILAGTTSVLTPGQRETMQEYALEIRPPTPP